MPSPSDIEELIAILTNKKGTTPAKWGVLRRVIDEIGGSQRVRATGSVRGSDPRPADIDTVILEDGRIRMKIYVNGPVLQESAGQSATNDFSKSEAHRLIQVISCLLAKSCGD